MTNREWLNNLSDEEYDKEVGLNYSKCKWCAYWREGKCNAGNCTCMRGRVMWLKMEHKE
jgi:hypothetical protein